MKPTIFLALLLLCNMAFSQSLITNSFDKKTGIRTIATKSIKGPEVTLDDTVARNGMLFFSAGYQEIKGNDKSTNTYFIELNIVHREPGLGCLQNGKSKVVLHMADKTEIECIQISDTDCDKVGFIAAFALMPKGSKPEVMKQNFDKLQSVDILKMEIFTSESSITFTTKTKSRPYIKSHLALISKTITQPY
jgi:hypothetical protein